MKTDSLVTIDGNIDNNTQGYPEVKKIGGRLPPAVGTRARRVQKFLDPHQVNRKFSDPDPMTRKFSDPDLMNKKFSDPDPMTRKFSDPDPTGSGPDTPDSIYSF
jgi:hypothetical protein